MGFSVSFQDTTNSLHGSDMALSLSSAKPVVRRLIRLSSRHGAGSWTDLVHRRDFDGAVDAGSIAFDLSFFARTESEGEEV